ncbi:MAG: class I SAM-dependent methyltransferase [Methylobacter sp.]|uniref:O-methyltransferase n=1 Tax=Methylobacter sp. TaxID=2051955 RepID=UPI0025835E1F|nr:class I SAM-dependent methyltransferase [Methylobacter sp.]MCL7421343.1 class I SAM-dependent methyltransferase [Methylobacter sp.]
MNNTVVSTILIIGFSLVLAGIALLALKLRQTLWNMHEQLSTAHSQMQAARGDLSQARQQLKQVLASLNVTSQETQNAVYLTQLDLQMPVFLGGWSIDTFLGKFLIQHLVESRPKTIVELGSGTSTVIIARALQIMDIHDYTHIAVDHEAKYLEISRKYAHFNGLADRVTWLECPLERFDSLDMLWYQGLTEHLQGKKIDFLVIDGPPGMLQKHSRYPALPILAPYLSEHCTVVLDDAIRKEEQEIARRWESEIPGFRLELSLAGHGMAVLVR